MSNESSSGLSDQDRNEADRQTSMRSPLIYEAVRQEGLEELQRPASSLAWSGLAAGIAMSFSVYAKGFLYNAAGDVPWSALVTNFGYCMGFLIVVLGRLQLFTENTITAVLPLLAEFSPGRLICTLRLWAIVFAANMIGALLSALCVTELSIVPDWQMGGLMKTFAHLADYSAYQTMAYGVPAGFLVAAMVWLMPAARGNEVLVIVSMSYLIGIGGLTHVVAGATEWFMLAILGEITWSACLFRFIAPALAGNIVGGAFLFALLSYGQVREEL